MDKKNSMINIQDLGLSTTSQHFVGGQPILWAIFRKDILYFKFFFQDIGGQPIP
jgi:hypothetical protein